MTIIFHHIRYILPFSVLLLIPFSYTYKDATFNVHHPEKDKYELWKILDMISHGTVQESDESDYTMEETSPEQQEEFFERSLDYSYRRRMPYKTCKIVREPIYEDGGFEPKYENVTCMETTEDPFRSGVPHTGNHEYCYIFHHSHKSVSCETKTRTIHLYKQLPGICEYKSQIIGVGCGCSTGVMYT